ncbi:hypothetical protein AVME950_12175 [Acidovorax sp. SUPP950]|uniref:hypothetical protein n=1 Tax=unclassified Acidovorax TaxID=2684926 RepID=UPI00234A43DA|nr:MULTISPECIES: hypothetical protein [Comamonadaceae]WCM98975.1 hypothetical protein M5C96_05955 [Acidovorax sp. GBBC 1281]WOI47491.1 hypothetical protein R1Z03_09910 [Paracidovorax avenae]GKS75653.1 hypothetical protein AVME950_12175 [Acidovorax sp. SUPP950]GKS90317.1 hypothetical protein AVTE2539_13150 [Acidovorax sp. SUPP2539]GKS94350.1 hypothetical protein AVAK2825_07465 [Acidovorax sp. SUPP2825]
MSIRFMMGFLFVVGRAARSEKAASARVPTIQTNDTGSSGAMDARADALKRRELPQSHAAAKH